LDSIRFAGGEDKLRKIEKRSERIVCKNWKLCQSPAQRHRNLPTHKCEKIKKEETKRHREKKEKASDATGCEAREVAMCISLPAYVAAISAANCYY